MPPRIACLILFLLAACGSTSPFSGDRQGPAGTATARLKIGTPVTPSVLPLPEVTPRLPQVAPRPSFNAPSDALICQDRAAALAFISLLNAMADKTLLTTNQMAAFFSPQAVGAALGEIRDLRGSILSAGAPPCLQHAKSLAVSMLDQTLEGLDELALHGNTQRGRNAIQAAQDLTQNELAPELARVKQINDFQP